MDVMAQHVNLCSTQSSSAAFAIEEETIDQLEVISLRRNLHRFYYNDYIYISFSLQRDSIQVFIPPYSFPLSSSGSLLSRVFFTITSLTTGFKFYMLDNRLKDGDITPPTRVL